MEEKFKQWLVQSGKPSAATNYPNAIHDISRHYSTETGVTINIYEIQDQNLISEIAHDYKQDGRFSQFGYKQHARYRNAIARYSEFFVTQDTFYNQESEQPNIDASERRDEIERINFSYERDLQTTLCSQISELFPKHKIYGENNLGVEYSIQGRRIDVLLEHVENKSLLAVELKSGTADFKVFGQISMYLGLLQNKFADTEISGVIIAGSIHESLQQACLITNKIELKIYRMSLELEDA